MGSVYIALTAKGVLPLWLVRSFSRLPLPWCNSTLLPGAERSLLAA